MSHPTLDATTGRRAGVPVGPHAEKFRAMLRALAGRTPTHRGEVVDQR